MRNDEYGQDLAEFALVMALIAIVAIIALVFLGAPVGHATPSFSPMVPSGA